VRANIFYPAPDPAIAIRPSGNSQKLSGLAGNSAEIYLAWLNSGYFPIIPMPAFR
jgi:hypothetical protein